MPNPASVEKQQGLNQVVINKVQRMVEGKRQGVMETITRLLDEGKIAQDFIAPIGVNLRGKEKQPVISFRAADRVQMTMPEGNFSLHGNAISQIFDKDASASQKALDAQTDAIEKSASALCTNLQQLVATQKQIAAEIPAFSPYDAMGVAQCTTTTTHSTRTATGPASASTTVNVTITPSTAY